MPPMESIDAYSNSDLVWLFFGTRTVVKASAIIGTYLCYHGFRALREKRVAEIINATVAAARLAAAPSSPTQGTENKNSETVGTSATENENSEPTPRSSQNNNNNNNNLIVVTPGNLQQSSATTLRDDDDINLVRRVNLGLDPTPQEQNSNNNNNTNSTSSVPTSIAGISNDDPSSPSSSSSSVNVIVAETSIADFPLLTARRSLTSFLDYLNPGQIVTEAVAIVLECAVLLTVSRFTLGCIAPDHGDSRYGELVSFPANKITNVRSWEVEDDQSNFTFNLSILRRWARRFVAAPPVALRKVFGELREDQSFKTVDQGSLVAKSLLGGMLYRDAVGISALKFPIWLGCLVTPMCVRFAFVESDLRKNLTWQDIRSMAVASALRSLCYSAASVFQEFWVSFWRARRIRRMEKKIISLQTELHLFDDNDEFVCVSPEFTIEEQRQQQRQQRNSLMNQNTKQRGSNAATATAGASGSSGGSLEINNIANNSHYYCNSQKFLPPNLFAGFLLSDSAQTQLIAAASNACWAFTSDVVGFSSMIFLRKYTFFATSCLRAEIAVTCSKLFCQAATLYLLRMGVTRLISLNFLTTSATSSSSKTSSKKQDQQQQKNKNQGMEVPPQSPMLLSTASSMKLTNNNSTNNNNNEVTTLPNNSPSSVFLLPSSNSTTPSLATTTLSTNNNTSASLGSTPSATTTIIITPPASQNQNLEQKNVSKNKNASSSLEADDEQKQCLSLFVNPLRKTVQSRIGASATTTTSGQKQQNQFQQQQGLSSPAMVPMSPAFPNTSTTSFLPNIHNQSTAASPPASPYTQNPNNNQNIGRNGNTNNNSLFPESPPLTSGLGGSSTNNNNNNSSFPLLSEHQQQQQKQRRRLLFDLEKAFGTSTALVLSHISDAVHSLLPSLAPDNNVRIHCLLYLHAVDEYVAAIASGEIQRNYSKIYSRYYPSPPHSHNHHHNHHHSKENSSSPSSILTPSSTSSLQLSSTNKNNDNHSNTQGALAASSNITSPNNVNPPSSSFFFNILEHRGRIHTPVHVFTAEEIAHRKSQGSAMKPFHCVSCKYTFREGYKAFVLPCGHLVHETCATRLKSDWCPRCVRPFEKPTSSDQTIRQYHEAHARFKDLVATWTKHVLLPAHLWFAEWRRVRQYISHKCDEDQLWHELRALELEKLKNDERAEKEAAINSNHNNDNSNNSSPPNQTATNSAQTTKPQSPVSPFDLPSPPPSASNIKPKFSLPPAAAAETSNNNNNNNNTNQQKQKQATRRRLRDHLHLLSLHFANETWAQHLVESQIVFIVPDDFAPSGYGLSDVPIVAALNALGVLAVNREHERTVAMIHETLVDGQNGSSSMTSGSRIVSFGGIRC